jgi:hypothetical protein
MSTRITPKYMLFLYISVPIFAFLYYITGTRLFDSPLTFYQYLIFTSLIAVVITGAYQIFFWVQRNNYFFKTKCLKTAFDDKIPFLPWMVWIYSFLYYIMIGYVVITIRSIEQGVTFIFAGLVLLTAQAICFMLFPCTVPPEWREYEPKTLSEKYLKFVQGVDNGRNCMPSMHCSVAMLVAMMIYPVFSYYSFIFVALIALSCLFVKQHQLLDLLPGILLGFLVYVLVL